MGNSQRHLIFLLILVVFTALGSPDSKAQVSFGLFSSDTLELNLLAVQELDFGSRVSGQGTVSINLEDEENGLVVPLEIVGVAYLDVTVTFPPTIELVQQDTGENTPDVMTLNVRMAYSNRGIEGEDFARSAAVQVPAGMGSATFQIQSRPGGPPGPPPTPPHAGYKPPTGTAYIYIYGDLDVGQVGAGIYRGDIDIHVQYF